MSTRARLLASSLLASSLLAACDRSGGYNRVPGDPGAGVLNVPYPVAEAERIEGAGRQALAEASFVFIALGAPPDDRDYALSERLTSDGPLLVAHRLEPVGESARTWQALRRLAFGRVAPTPGQTAPVPAAEVEALGLAPPAAAVWLVGPRGTCRATVGSPQVGSVLGASDTLAVGYRLEGCEGRRWAQIGIVADTIPVDFRWIPAEDTADLTFPRGETWDDPLAPLVEPPGWEHESDARFESVRLREIPGVSPRVVQVHRAWLSERPEQTERPWCEIDVAWSRADGWTNERWIDPIPWHPDAVGPFMLGAFVNGTQVDAMIYDDRLDGLVVVPPAPLDDMGDPQAWRQVFVPTGLYDAETLAGWGVQPARGPGPIGPSCDRAEAAG